MSKASKRIGFLFQLGSGLILVGCSYAQASTVVLHLVPDESSLRANIEAHVGTPRTFDASTLQRFMTHADEQARLALQALGYYRPTVKSTIEGEGEAAHLRLDIDAGEPVRLRQVDIRVEGEAARLAAFQVPNSEQLQSGAVLNHGAYDDAKRFITNQGLRFGFFDGHFSEHRLSIDPEAGVADIVLHYVSGARYRVGSVKFLGDTPFDDDFLQRFVPFRVPVAYNTDRLAELNQSLTASGYFQDIRLDANPAQAEGSTLPLNVTLKTRPARTLGSGLGFSTDVGPRLRTGFERHWLGHQGHRYGSDFELSGPRQHVEGWYAIPLNPPTTHQLRFTGGYQQEDLVDTQSQRLSLGAEWQQQLMSRWTQYLSLRWEQENYQIGEENGQSSLLLPSIRWTRTVTDNRIDPTHGWRAEAAFAATQRSFLSDVDLMRAYLNARRLSTFENRHRLLLRAELGGLWSNNFSAIPPSLRFFAGGDQSVRGFDYQTLSPRDGQNDTVGGHYLLVGSAEYQIPVAERWRAAAFIDHGNAFDQPHERLMTGIGVGVRWVSPLGPLRIDLARGLAEDGGGFRLHFSMGPEL